MNRRIALTMLVGTALTLSACGSDDEATTTTAAAATTAAPAPETSAAAAAGVTVEGAWARNSPMMATAGAAYMVLTSAAGDTLIGASTDPSIAGKVEIHETRMVDGGMGTDTTMAMGGDTTMPGMDMGSDTTMPGMGAMEMVQIMSLDLPAGMAVELKPGGYHIMLLDLPAPLELGSTFELTLTFEQAGDQVVEVVVAESAP